MSVPKAPPAVGSNFRAALIQMGGITSDKTANLAQARELIRTAAKGDSPDKEKMIGMIVLPVSFPALRWVVREMTT